MDRRPPLPRPWRHGRRPRSAPPRAAPAMPTWWGGGLNQHAHRAPPCDPPSCAASIDARGRVGGTPGGWRGRDEPPGAVQKILSGAGIVCFAESSAASAAVGIEREPPPTLIADAAESAHTPTGAPRPRSRPGPNRGIAGWGGVDGQRRRPRREGKKKKTRAASGAATRPRSAAAIESACGRINTAACTRSRGPACGPLCWTGGGSGQTHARTANGAIRAGVTRPGLPSPFGGGGRRSRRAATAAPAATAARKHARRQPRQRRGRVWQPPTGLLAARSHRTAQRTAVTQSGRGARSRRPPEHRPRAPAYVGTPRTPLRGAYGEHRADAHRARQFSPPSPAGRRSLLHSDNRVPADRHRPFPTANPAFAHANAGARAVELRTPPQE